MQIIDLESLEDIDLSILSSCAGHCSYVVTPGC